MVTNAYDHQSIFTDTYHGIPNPRRTVQQNYPSLYHGPVWRYPRFDMSHRTWRENPYTMPLQPSPIKQFGDAVGSGTAPLFQSATGSMLIDALLGAGVGYLAAPSESSKKAWVAAGALASAFAGMAGLIGAAGAGIYAGMRK